MDLHELQHFAFGHGRRGFGQDIHDALVVQTDGVVEGLGVKVIADQDACLVAPERIGRGPPAAELGLIDDVIMEERRRVDVFDHAAQKVFGVVFAEPAESGREEVQQRAEPLAARAEDVFADLLDERNVGAQALMDPALHAFHVGFVFL